MYTVEWGYWVLDQFNRTKEKGPSTTGAIDIREVAKLGEKLELLPQSLRPLELAEH